MYREVDTFFYLVFMIFTFDLIIFEFQQVAAMPASTKMSGTEYYWKISSKVVVLKFSSLIPAIEQPSVLVNV